MDYIACVFPQRGMVLSKSDVIANLRGIGSHRPELSIANALTYGFLEESVVQNDIYLRSTRDPR